MFTDNRIVKDLRYMGQKYFGLKTQSVHKKTKTSLLLNRWKFSQAPAQSDILWSSINCDPNISFLKTSILILLLFVISVILVTPILLINTAFDLFSQWDLIDGDTLHAYLQTYLTLFVNVVLIPFLIDMMVLMEDFETKSDRQIAILNRNFVFMILNSVLLPLTHNETIKSFISTIGKNNLWKIPSLLSSQLTSNYVFFL